jgi:hypothetical protein
VKGHFEVLGVDGDNIKVDLKEYGVKIWTTYCPM